jgi:hypothetical protein
VPRSREYNLGTVLILLPVHALDEFSDAARDTMKSKKCQIGVFWALWKAQNKAIPTVSPEWQTDKWKALKPCAKAANVPKWAPHSQEGIWESGGEVADGAGKRVMECEMCTEDDKERRGWERQWQ